MVVLTAVAALSFTLGFYAGSSGRDGHDVGNAAAVVPEGAGLVLLGSSGQNCAEQRDSGADGFSSTGVVLETMKVPLSPEPDGSGFAGPEEPVLEPVSPGSNFGKAASGKGSELEIMLETRRVAPARQLPRQTGEPADLASITREARAAAASAEPEEEAGADSLGGQPDRDGHEDDIIKAPPKRRRPPQKKKTASSASAATGGAVADTEAGAYSVQIGAFSSLSDAHKHKLRFAKKGYKASVYKDIHGSGNMYKVRIGAFIRRQSAEDMARKLKDVEGVNAFVTLIE